MLPLYFFLLSALTEETAENSSHFLLSSMPHDLLGQDCVLFLCFEPVLSPENQLHRGHLGRNTTYLSRGVRREFYVQTCKHMLLVLRECFEAVQRKDADQSVGKTGRRSSRKLT